MGRGGQDTEGEKTKTVRMEAKAENVEKMSEARERGKREWAYHIRQEGDRAEEGRKPVCYQAYPWQKEQNEVS